MGTHDGDHDGTTARGRGRLADLASTGALALADVAALLLSAAVAYACASMLHWVFGSGGYVDAWKVASDRMASFAAVAAGAVAWFSVHGHHRSGKPFWEEAKEVCVVGMFCLLAEGFLHFAQKGDVSRLLIAMTWTVAPAVVMPLRRVAKAALRSTGLCTSRAVVFGGREESEHAVAALTADPHLGYRVVGTYPVMPETEAIALVRGLGADVAVVVQGADTATCNGLAAALAASAVPLIVVPPVSGIPVVGMQAQYVIGMDTVLLVDRSDPDGAITRAAKRCFDIGVAGIILAVAAVPMLAVAALVAADGGAPVFGHERVGQGGRRFRCLKLRTMVRNSDEVLARHLESDPAAREEWERDRKLRRDPRVTRLGAFLRKTAMDEIPQLVNVIRGDMSLVGPRPVTVEELERYGEASRQYLAVRPGITGLWQVSGRNDVTYAQRVSLDAWYVRNWSAWNDLVILVRTVPAVVLRRGAY